MDGISLRVFNSIAHEWDIELKTRRETPYLHARCWIPDFTPADSGFHLKLPFLTFLLNNDQIKEKFKLKYNFYDTSCMSQIIADYDWKKLVFLYVTGDDIRHYEIAHKTVFNQLNCTLTFAKSRKICIYTVIFQE